MFLVDVKDKDHFVAKFSFDQRLVDAIKGLPNRTYDKKVGEWVFPIVDLFILKKIAAGIGVEVMITPEANKQYLALADELAKLKELSDAKKTEHTVDGLRPEVKLYDFQKVGIHFLDTIQSGLMGYDMGLGKCQPLDSRLLTPSGWKKMADIKIGNEVFGSDGLPHKVIGVYPQGKKDIYKVTFTDGSSVESCDEHLWTVRTATHKARGVGYKTLQLKDIQKAGLRDSSGNTKWFIPLVDPLYFEDSIQPVDPYVLGILIGDGNLSGLVRFSSADNEIVDSVRLAVPAGFTLKQKSKYDYTISAEKRSGSRSNPLLTSIRNLGLCVKSYDKFIPDLYKFASTNQRVAILQGLMDTDGGVDTKDGIVITYTSTSEKLIDDVMFLVQSLSGVARKTSRTTSYTYNGIKKKGRVSYRLNISLPSHIVPFRLGRKLKTYRPRSKYQPARGMKLIEYVGLKKAQCIAVDTSDNLQDDNHLYTTDNCILTHNTPIGISVASNAIKRFKAKKTLVVVPASMKYQWGYQIAKFSNYSYTMVVGKDREPLYRKNTNFTIVNYDLLWRDIDQIKDIEWDLVICDEIQRARNFRTDTFKALNQLNCKRKIGLTGTPIENDLMDLFTIMKFLNPKVFGTNPFPFINRYCTLNYFGQIDHSKYKNLSEINKKLSYSMIRRKKRDVLDELPEKTVNHIYVNLNDAEKKKYKEIKNGILEDIKTGKIKSIAALAQTVYLRQLCDCLNLVVEKDKIVSSKLEELKVILKELPADSKIIIFTQFERMAKIIEDNIGMKSVHLHGGVASDCRWEREIEKDVLKKNAKMPQRDLDVLVYEEKLKAKCASCPYYNDDSKCLTRKKIQAKFQNEQDIRVFISTNAGASGLDLQVANVLINYDMSFNPAVNEQRIARIDRMGQKAEKILIINLVCIDTIEEKVLKILEKKQKLFDDVIDNNLDEAEAERIIFNKNNIKDLI